jgi:non-canonical (house-cleaning) NTP pyrophosphatase
MNIGFYTSQHYLESKKQALEEAIKKLGLDATQITDESSILQSSSEQAFGFEQLFERSKEYAATAIKSEKIDVGIGVASGLSFIYSADEWYYVICIALHTKSGGTTASFTPGISVPIWMVKEVQDTHTKLDVLTERLAGTDDPVIYFSGKTLTRKELMVPTLLLAFSKLGLDKNL